VTATADGRPILSRSRQRKRRVEVASDRLSDAVTPRSATAAFDTRHAHARLSTCNGELRIDFLTGESSNIDDDIDEFLIAWYRPECEKIDRGASNASKTLGLSRRISHPRM